MAHRDTRKSRVLAVAAGVFVALASLWLRIGWLQVVCHDSFERRAELNQELRVALPALRGQLLDRGGRPLAHNLMTYSISVAPREMKNPHATARDLARVLDLDPARLKHRFATGGHRMVARRVPPEVGLRIASWNRRGVYVAAETRREYPLGPAATEIIGHTDVDNHGVEGLELQLDDHLRGQAGWMTMTRDGRGGAHALARGLRRDPENGRHAVLTLDLDLQSIVETHLARAIDTLDAKRGFAIFLDPRTGEVLAAVNVPHLPRGKARNWNIVDQFEPGSTFKVVTAGAVLEEGLARPDQVFEASETGAALIAPGAVFHDVHKQASFTFRDAVRWSSNIVMGKLGLLLGSERLYRAITDLGFGSVTGLSFPGEAGGKLRSPDRWSARSCPTLAIGHEISVTPLQLALAYAAIANGGVLMRPMLVREVLDPDGERVRRFSPRASHRVFSPSTTRVLREMLTAVVDSGTARAARVPGLAVAGKTGTAQKYDPRTGTYSDRVYLASFAGFAPAADPILVGVVVIDEAHGDRYHGGQVAAPVFREVLLDLLRLPDGPLQEGQRQVASRPPAPAPVVVPDLRLLLRSGVERRLAEFGLRPRFRGPGARAIAQEPEPGAAIERGASVTVWTSAPDDSAARHLPDLVGLPLREALRRLGRLEIEARLEGRGVVARQSPAPGAPLPLAGPCRLWCEPGMAVPAEDVAVVARNAMP